MNPKDHPTRIGEENKYEDSVFFRQISVNMVFPENMTSRPKTNERTEASQKIENLPNELKKRLCKNCGRVYNQCKCKNPPPSTPLRCWSRKKEANQRKLDPNAVIRETIKKTQPDPIDKKCTGYVKSPKITKKRKETNDGEKIEVIEDEKPLSEVEVEAAPKKKKIINRNKSPKISIESSPKVDDVSKKTEEIFKANDKPKTAQNKKAKVLAHKSDQKVETARKTSSSKDVRQTVTPQNVADFVKKMTSLNEPAKIPTEDQQAMKPFLENIRAMDKKTRETFLNNLSSETRLSIISILSKTSDLAVLPKFTEASIFSEKISEFKYLASLEEIKNVQVAPEIESMPTKDDVESTTKTLPPDLESNSSETAKNLAESDLVIPSVSSPRPSNLTEATRKEEIIEKSSIEDEQPRETLDNITMDMDDAVNPNMSSLDPNDSSSVVENTQSLPSTIQPKSEQTSTISNQNLIKVRNDLMAPSSKGTIENELFSKKSERSDNKGSTSPREKLSDCRCKRKLTMTSYRNKPGRKSKASDLVYKIVCVPSNAKIEKSAALSEKNRIKIAKCTQTGGTFEQDFIASFVAKCASNEITPTPPKFFINTMFGDKSERKLNVRRHKNGLLTRPRYSVSLRPLVRSMEMMKTYNKANQTLAFARLNNFYPWASLVNYSVCPVSIVNDKKLPLGQQQTLRTKLALDLNKLRESHGMNKTTCGSPERKENQTCAKASSDHFEECIPQKICLAMQTDPENQVCISITPVQTDPCSVEHCIRKLVHILNEDPKTSGKIQVCCPAEDKNQGDEIKTACDGTCESSDTVPSCAMLPKARVRIFCDSFSIDTLGSGAIRDAAMASGGETPKKEPPKICRMCAKAIAEKAKIACSPHGDLVVKKSSVRPCPFVKKSESEPSVDKRVVAVRSESCGSSTCMFKEKPPVVSVKCGPDNCSQFVQVSPAVEDKVCGSDARVRETIVEETQSECGRATCKNLTCGKKTCVPNTCSSIKSNEPKQPVSWAVPVVESPKEELCLPMCSPKTDASKIVSCNVMTCPNEKVEIRIQTSAATTLVDSACDPATCVFYEDACTGPSSAPTRDDGCGVDSCPFNEPPAELCDKACCTDQPHIVIAIVKSCGSDTCAFLEPKKTNDVETCTSIETLDCSDHCCPIIERSECGPETCDANAPAQDACASCDIESPDESFIESCGVCDDHNACDYDEVTECDDECASAVESQAESVATAACCVGFKTTLENDDIVALQVAVNRFLKEGGNNAFKHIPDES